MANYSESFTSNLGLNSFSIDVESPQNNSNFQRSMSSNSGLKSRITKGIAHLFSTLVGQTSQVIKSISKRLSSFLGNISTITKSLGIKRSLVDELGISLTEDFTYSVGGTPVGTRVYYRTIWGIWYKEAGRVKVKITDILSGRARMAEIIVSNPQNSKEVNYSSFKKIKLVDYLTNETLFFGRVGKSNNAWDSELGQVLFVTAYDYMYELTQRYVTGNYITPLTRANLVNEIVQDNVTLGTIGRFITSGGSTEEIVRDYTNSSKKVSQVIEELALEDSVNASALGCDYRTNDSAISVFEYFVRGTRPIGGTGNGLTISLTDAIGNQTKRMLSDFDFSATFVEMITRVIVRGEDVDGNKLESTATDDVLEEQYNIRIEHVDTVYGATTQGYLDTRASELLKILGNPVWKGKCSIIGYPTYKIGASYYSVRAGDLVHIHNSLQSIDTDYLVVSLTYEEPPVITKFELLQFNQYGRELPRLLPKQAISVSDIGDAKNNKLVYIKVISETTTLTIGDGKTYVNLDDPVFEGMNLVGARATIYTASTSGLPTIQIYNVTQAVDMLTIKITIDENETRSVNADIPIVIDTDNDDVAEGDQIRIDVDVAGTGTKGLDIILKFRK